MSSRIGDGSDAAATMMGRLRQIQEDFADEEPAVRQQHLREELERALAPMLPGQREQFLGTLAERMPAASEGGGQSIAQGGNGTAGGPKSNDPEALADALAESVQTLDAEGKARIAAQLSRAGLLPKPAAASDGGGVAMGEELRDRLEELKLLLRIRPDDDVPLERVVDLVLELLPFVKQSGQVSVRIWRDFSSQPGAPQSASRTPPDVQRAITRYLAGDKGASREEVAKAVAINQRLNGSLLQSLNVITRIANQICDRFSVEKIERMAKLEQKKVGFLKRKTDGEASWEVFKQIASKFDGASLERDIKRGIAEYVEDFLRLHGGK
jgi:hypothetical protein